MQELSNKTNQLRFRSVRWDITNRCNLRCAHCFAAPDEQENFGGDLNFYEIIHIIRKLKLCGLQEINFAGREPTMHKDILQIIRWCCDNGIAINLATNGTFFDKTQYEELMSLGVKMVIFSLDGSTEESHDRLRGDGSFLRTLQNITNSHNFINDKGVNTKLGISCTLHRLNVDEVPGMVDLAASLGISFLSINPISFLGAAMPMEKDFYLSPEEILDCFSDVCSRYCKLKSKFDIFLGLFPMEAKFLNAKYGLDLPIILTGCAAGRTMYVDHKGNALPCYMLPAISNKISGFKKYLNYWRILSEPESTAVKRFKPFISFTELYSQADYDGCRDCPDLNVCKPCPLIAISEPETVYRCQLARKKLSLLTPLINDNLIPEIKSYIKWNIQDSILILDITKGDYFCGKEYELNSIAESIWLSIDGKTSYRDIMQHLKNQHPRLSEVELHSNLKHMLTYFWIEGVLTFKK